MARRDSEQSSGAELTDTVCRDAGLALSTNFDSMHF